MFNQLKIRWLKHHNIIICLELSVPRGGWATTAPWSFFAVLYLLEVFFPDPSTACLRLSVPSCSTACALWGSTGIVAARSGSVGVATDTEGSSSRDPLALISDPLGTVKSPAVSSGGPELGSTAPEPDWKRRDGGGTARTQPAGFVGGRRAACAASCTLHAAVIITSFLTESN